MRLAGTSSASTQKLNDDDDGAKCAIYSVGYADVPDKQFTVMIHLTSNLLCWCIGRSP